jgi:hypothetical protein
MLSPSSPHGLPWAQDPSSKSVARTRLETVLALGKAARTPVSLGMGERLGAG